MPYNIEIRNANGDLAIDENPAMVVKDTGTTIKPTTNHFRPRGYGHFPWDNKQSGDFGEPPFYTYVGNAEVPRSNGIGTAPDFIMEQDELAFVEIPPSGISQMVVYHNFLSEYPNGGTLFVMGPDIDTTKWAIFAPARGKWFPRTHGIVVKSPTGGEIFDTRRVNLGVGAAFDIPSSAIENILWNDTALDIFLPLPMPNALVSSSDMMSSLIVGSWGTDAQDFRYLNITQPNASTIRLSRIVGRGPGDITSTNVLSSVFTSFTLLVARNAIF